MSHDEINDWYYDDADEDDIRVFDPNAVYRDFVDEFDDFDDDSDEWVDPDLDEIDQLEEFDEDLEDFEGDLEAVDDSRFYDEE